MMLIVDVIVCSGVACTGCDMAVDAFVQTLLDDLHYTNVCFCQTVPPSCAFFLIIVFQTEFRFMLGTIYYYLRCNVMLVTISLMIYR